MTTAPDQPPSPRARDQVEVRPFADGLRIAYRVGTVDEHVITHGFAAANLDGGRKWLRPGGVLLDVGAHIGTLALRAAARAAPGGRVLAVEPNRDSYELLVRNIALNRLENVEADHLALSDRSGPTRLHHHDENWGHSTTKVLSGSGEDVQALTLADYLERRKVEAVDIAKFNCEGAEFSVLMATGAEDLRRIERLLVLYHLDLVNEGYGLDDLERHLSAAGFEVEIPSVGRDRGQLLASRR